MAIRLLVATCVLLCIFKVCVSRVAVTTDDFTVDCGEETIASFGPFLITINVTGSLWDANNYTIYAFEDPDPAGGDCDFTQTADVYTNPLVIDNTTYTGYYEWKYDIIPTLDVELGEQEKCGWKRTTESRLEIDIAVVEGTLFNANDKVFRITCDYNPDSINKFDVGEADIIPTPPEIGGSATPNALDRLYHLELIAADTGRVIDGTVPIGTEVQLRVRAEGADDGFNENTGAQEPGAVAGDENGVKVSNCRAENSDGDNDIQLIFNYCTDFKDGVDWVEKPDSADRKGFTSVDMLAFSPAFEMFAIVGGAVDHVVIFSCDIDICRIDKACDGDNCPSKKKKRDTSPKLDALSVFRSKRAADVTGQTQLTMTIVVDETGGGGGGGGDSSVVSDAAMSAEMTTLVIALSVLGVLLMLCVLAAVAVAMRLTKAKRRVGEKKTIIHHENPAYATKG